MFAVDWPSSHRLVLDFFCRRLDSSACVENPSTNRARSSTVILCPQGVRHFVSQVFIFSDDFGRFVLGPSRVPSRVPVVGFSRSSFVIAVDFIYRSRT